MPLWLTILGLGSASALATCAAAWSVGRWFRLKPATSAVAGWAAWVLASSGLLGLCYVRATAEAAAGHQANIGIPILYFSLWMLCSIVSPAIGLAGFLAKANLSPD